MKILLSTPTLRLAFLVFGMTMAGQSMAATPSENVDEYLSSARIADGVNALSARLDDEPGNDDLRFALGFLQFADAIEYLGQSWYVFGLQSHSMFSRMLPFMRLPVPDNPQPQPMSYEDGRRVLQEMTDKLAASERTLAGIHGDDIGLDVYLGRAYFDFNANGAADDDEALWRILGSVSPGTGLNDEIAHDFCIALDAGDVHWLRGYAHLLSALLEFYLSHDGERLFNHSAHLFFSNPDTPFPFLAEVHDQEDLPSVVFDVMALIHTIDLPVIEPERREEVVRHLQAVIDQSRLSWKAIRAETDDEREWVPNPDQTGVIPNVRVTEEQIVQWHAFLDEVELILTGQTLVPFWRGETPRGINLRRALLKSERFDLVHWIQGPGVAPYFEDGPITEAAFWRELRQAFGGQFIGFALWFN